MKEIIAKELLFFFMAILVAIPVAFLFLYALDPQPVSGHLSEDEKVLEMDLLMIGGVLGFVGFYILRLTVWAVKKVMVGEEE